MGCLNKNCHCTFVHYRPQTKLREGNVFTLVFYSVHRGVSAYGSREVPTSGSGECLPLGLGECTPPLDTHTPLWANTPPPVEMSIEAGGTYPTGMHSCLKDAFESPVTASFGY